MLWWPGVISLYDDDGNLILGATLNFATKPRDTWFYAPIPGGAWGWPGASTASAVDTYYWFYIISASGGHKTQLAIKSPVTRTSEYGYTVQADIIYILCYEDDTPNWGNTSSMISIAPPCANWYTDLYEVPAEVMRSQTSGLQAAIQGIRERDISIISAVAKEDSEDIGILAAVQAELELPITIQAAIKGARERSLPIRAAIRSECIVEPDIIAAVAKEDSEDIGILATIQGERFVYDNLKAAILGEAERTVGITAVVVKSRADKILLEMENLWPQELDLRSTPNWASRTKDYRKDSLGS
jgi:hypothetical protein